MRYIPASDFLERRKNTSVVDVRSPEEYNKGHITDALNIPLFNDDERKMVGTLYRKSGKDSSLLTGLDIVGPKLSGFVKTVLKASRHKEVLVHCWRGGMRSSSMAWLFELAGLEVFVLEGGYKAYKRFVRERLADDINLIVLGGKTGSGKSDILEYIYRSGKQVIDLEKIAAHKGSAFGALGQKDQPTTEQFENNLYEEVSKLDLNHPIWIEDESRAIGHISLPELFFDRMRQAPVIFLDIAKDLRVKRLVKEYALFDNELLESAVLRISKRLGSLNTKIAIESIKKNDFETAASILLIHYDKAYLKGLSMRDQGKVFKLEITGDDPKLIAEQVLEYYGLLEIYST